MKKTKLISIAIATVTAAQLMLAPAMTVSAAKTQNAGVIVNQDAAAIAKAISSEEGYRAFADGFAGTQVTDYVISLNSVQAGLTHVKTLCKTFSDNGINAWLSFRMNDAQDTAVETSSLVGDFLAQNPKLRRVQTAINNDKYYNNCLDYTYEAVRKHMLGLINTALSNYDCYGIELDFQREIWLWYTGGEYNGMEILNGFMREVDRLTKTYAIKYGHDIKVAVRCASDILTNYEFGLDLGAWASEGIIDQVSPSGRYSTTDNDIPVRLWVSFLRPYGITVAPCIERNIVSGIGGTTGAHTMSTVAAAAANFLSQGADKIYVHNYHLGSVATFAEADKVAITDGALSVNSANGFWNVINTVGSYSKLMALDRRMILTYNDTKQRWAEENAQLPATVKLNTPVALRIPIGDIPAGATVTLKFSTTVPTDTPVVYINSARATLKGTEACVGGFTENTLLCYQVPEAALDDMYILAEITPQTKITIDYAEVYVDVAG